MATPIDFSTPMQLLFKANTEQERVVITFPHGLGKQGIFSKESNYLEQAMNVSGIPIPIQQREQYPELVNNKIRQAIYLHDDSFGKAFYFIYFQQTMNPENYTWKKL
jgi:hypothetical protein